MSGVTEDELRRAVLEVELLLKKKQAFWETPRNLAIVLTAVAAVAGIIGFKLGNAPTRIEVTQPLVVKLVPNP